MTTDQTVEQQLAPLAERHADLAEQRDRITAAMSAVKTAMLDVVGGAPDRYGAGDLTVTVSLNRRLDLDRAAERVVGRGVAPDSLRSSSWDKAKVERHLTAADRDELMDVTGEPRMVIR